MIIKRDNKNVTVNIKPRPGLRIKNWTGREVQGHFEFLLQPFSLASKYKKKKL